MTRKQPTRRAKAPAAKKPVGTRKVKPRKPAKRKAPTSQSAKPARKPAVPEPSPSMKYCAHCGAVMEVRWRYCRECGERVSADKTNDADAPTSVAPASLGQRLAALALDLMAVVALQVAIGTVAAAVAASSTPVDLGPEDAARALSFLTDVTVFLFVPFTIAFIYFGAFGSGRRGQTLGQRAVKIRLVTVDGGPVGFWRAGLRSSARLLSALPLFWGFFAMTRNPRHQTWHDHLAGTAVVAGDVLLAEQPGAWGWRVGALIGAPVLVAALIASSLAGVNALHEPDRRPLSELQAGDCVIDPGWVDPDFHYDWLRVVGCDELHDSEVVGWVDHSDEAYDEFHLTDLGNAECGRRYEEFLGADARESLFPLDYVIPSEDQWRRGERRTVCMVTGNEYLYGSLRERLGERARPGSGSIG